MNWTNSSLTSTSKWWDCKCIERSFGRVDYLCKLDLKGGIFVYSLEQGVRKFVGFEWKNTLKEFLILYFGLGSEPGFKKKRVIIYLDGFLILRRTLDDVYKEQGHYHLPFETSQFCDEYEKSLFCNLQWNWNRFQVGKWNRFQMVAEVSTIGEVRARALSKLLGILNSTILAVLSAPI